MAAFAEGCGACVVYDERRPDLNEEWFYVMAGVKSVKPYGKAAFFTAASSFSASSYFAVAGLSLITGMPA